MPIHYLSTAYLHLSVRLLRLFACIATQVRKTFTMDVGQNKCSGGGVIWLREVFSSLFIISTGPKKVRNSSRPPLSLSSLLPFPSPPFPSPPFPSPPLPFPLLPLEVGLPNPARGPGKAL